MFSLSLKRKCVLCAVICALHAERDAQNTREKGLMFAVLEKFMVIVELQITLSGLSRVQMSVSTINDACPRVLQT